jgi:hypothetical protein
VAGVIKGATDETKSLRKQQKAWLMQQKPWPMEQKARLKEHPAGRKEFTPHSPFRTPHLIKGVSPSFIPRRGAADWARHRFGRQPLISKIAKRGAKPLNRRRLCWPE